LSADVDREITGEIETLLALGASPSLRQGDFAEFRRQAEAALTLRARAATSGSSIAACSCLSPAGVPFGTILKREVHHTSLPL
jgi:hypothetical protein